MSYVTWKIEHIPYVNNDWDNADKTTIGSFRDVLLNVKLGDGRDDFTFRVTNFNEQSTNFYNPNDKIIISRVANSATVTTDNIIMVGTIKDVPFKQVSNDNTLIIKGYNYSETVMSAITFVDASNLNVVEAIKEGLDQVGATNANFKVAFAATNPTVKTDGSAFPTVGKKFFYKPLRDIAEKYSTKERTEDTFYYYYVDLNSELIWRPGNSTDFGDYTFDSTTDEYTSLQVKKDISGVRNFVINKGGLGPDNKQIQSVYRDYSSISKHGTKFQIMVSENVTAKNLTKDDIGTTETVDSYPDLSSSFTTTWDSTTDAVVVAGSSSATMVVGSKTTVDASNEDNRKKLYSAVIKTEVKARLKREAKTFVENRQYGKLQVTIDFRAGTKVWGLGDRITSTIPELQEIAKELRVSEIQYGTTTDTFTLEEDEASL